MFRRVVPKSGSGRTSFASTGERGLKVLAAESSDCTSCGAGSCPVTALLQKLGPELKSKVDAFSVSIKLFVKIHGAKKADEIRTDQEMQTACISALESLDEVLVIAIQTQNQTLLTVVSNILIIEGNETFYQLAKFMAERHGKHYLAVAIAKSEANRRALFGEQSG